MTFNEIVAKIRVLDGVMVSGWPDSGLKKKKKKKRTPEGGMTAAGAVRAVVRWSFLSQSQSLKSRFRVLWMESIIVLVADWISPEGHAQVA